MAPRPPPGRPTNGQSGASIRKPAQPLTEGALARVPQHTLSHFHVSLDPWSDRPACCPGPAAPPTINDADYEAFEGLFESARTRRATQQRATADLGGAGDPTASMQERVYGAVLSPRVVRSGLDTWTRAVSVGLREALLRALARVAAR